MIVSVPVDLSDDPELKKLEEKGIQARYVSVELLKELPDGKVEWRMATSSRAEGNLPQFLTERAMPSSIANVCSSIISYVVVQTSHFDLRMSPGFSNGCTRFAKTLGKKNRSRLKLTGTSTRRFLQML